MQRLASHFLTALWAGSGLRKERDKGRLVTEMIAGKEYTTLADIERMRELCRFQPAASPGARENNVALARAREILLARKQGKSRKL